jgi:TRAP-type C4-dicarboxylate transport system permease small subunit
VKSSAVYVTRLAGIVSMAGLFLIALLTVVDVGLRWLFNAPIEGQSDIAEALLPIIIAATFVSAAWGRPHVGIRFAGAVLGRTVRRILDVLSDLSIAVFLALIVIQFWNYAGEIADEHRQTWVLQIPLYPFWYATAVLLGITTAVQLLNVVVNARSPVESETRDAAA